MPITAFDHYTVRCADLDAAWAFYRDALGLRVEPRPLPPNQSTGTPGPRAALVYLTDAWLVHLFQATAEQDAVFRRIQPTDDEAARWQTGRMHHIALQGTDAAEIKARLQRYGAEFWDRTIGERYQIIVKDPDGVELEINFPRDEGGA
jgi:catechol 2,3-dioxygenase-like lactoylglutathione lyase family enzyme